MLSTKDSSPQNVYHWNTVERRNKEKVQQVMK